jgi:hypothetical protein
MILAYAAGWLGGEEFIMLLSPAKRTMTYRLPSAAVKILWQFTRMKLITQSISPPILASTL